MAQARQTLKAEKREIFGKKVKKLRKQGILPASIYGNEFASQSVQLNLKEVEKLFGHAGESSLIDLQLDGATLPVLFKNPQYNPLSGNLTHIDLHKVNLKEKITAMVPIEIIGESPAVKAGNVLMEITMEIEVEALPTDLPEKITIDISKLENVDQAITAADLTVDRKKVEVITEADQVIVKVAAPKEEVIEEVAAPAPTEVPATAQKAPEEAETDKAKAMSTKKE